MTDRRVDPGQTPALGSLDQLDLGGPARREPPVSPTARAASRPRRWPWVLLALVVVGGAALVVGPSGAEAAEGTRPAVAR